MKLEQSKILDNCHKVRTFYTVLGDTVADG